MKTFLVFLVLSLVMLGSIAYGQQDGQPPFWVVTALSKEGASPLKLILGPFDEVTCRAWAQMRNSASVKTFTLIEPGMRRVTYTYQSSNCVQMVGP